MAFWSRFFLAKRQTKWFDRRSDPTLPKAWTSHPEPVCGSLEKAVLSDRSGRIKIARTETTVTQMANQKECLDGEPEITAPADR